ncbi:hypothetical protein Tco_0033636, partial [Tanacetum coccineum]
MLGTHSLGSLLVNRIVGGPEFPRAVSWTRTAKCIKWEYFAELFDKDMTLKGNCFEKEERFKKFSPKNKDLSHSTSEDEPENKDDISPKE